MNWGLLAFAAGSLAIAVGLWWWRSRVGREIALMNSTPTSLAVQVARLAPGSIVEVKGALRCAMPLLGDLSKQPCVYFKSETQREVVYYEPNSKGERERKTRTESVHSNTRFAACEVEDTSGRVALRIDGATIEGQEVVNKRESEPQSLAGALLSVSVAGIGIGSGQSSTLIHTETILATDVPVYVLGEVTADHAIGKPASGSSNRIFVVSTKSEEERAKSLGSSMTWILVFAILFAVIAAVLVFFAIKAD